MKKDDRIVEIDGNTIKTLDDLQLYLTLAKGETEFVVERDGKYIGFVGSLDFTNDGIMEIWYAINKNLRGRGYGEKVLAEITPYLIEHVDGLKDIELNIDKSNKGSIKVAERNGYVFDHEEDGYMTYYYFGPNYDRGSRKR